METERNPHGAGWQAGVPGVVLVHGPGPHDRDEEIYSNRIFRDIAEGLEFARYCGAALRQAHAHLRRQDGRHGFHPGSGNGGGCGARHRRTAAAAGSSRQSGLRSGAQPGRLCRATHRGPRRETRRASFSLRPTPGPSRMSRWIRTITWRICNGDPSPEIQQRLDALKAEVGKGKESAARHSASAIVAGAARRLSDGPERITTRLRRPSN